MMKLNNINKVYQTGKLKLTVLHDINLEIEDGVFIAIMGPSGSGKSTLMNIIGFLDSPTSGTYELNNQVIYSTHENQLATLRNQYIGFVFQQFFCFRGKMHLKM